MKRVFLYTNTARAFRTTMLGYLYEMAQTHEVILLSEELDVETQKLVSDKSLFPGINEIIRIDQYAATEESLIARNRRIYRAVSDLFARSRPDIVIASSDVHSLFEMYLMRLAKRTGALRVTIQDTVTFRMDEIARWCDLQNVYLRTPTWLPFYMRLGLVKLRKFLGHVVYYWALPLIEGERPFFGKVSYILHKGHTGMRDTNCHVVWSRRQFDLYRASGVPENKLIIIPHPLARSARFIFECAYRDKAAEYSRQQKTVIVLLPYEGFGFRKSDMSIIPTEQRIALFRWLLDSIEGILNKWHVIIKPHPMYIDAAAVTARLGKVSERIEVVDSAAPVDYYLEIADAIIDLPRSASTAVFSALQQCPGKPILSIDIDREFLGDYYARFHNVDYIDSKQKFLDDLVAIRDGKWMGANAGEMLDEDFHHAQLTDLILNLQLAVPKAA
jgi:hypothetical protein